MEFVSKTLDSTSFKEAVYENKQTMPFKYAPLPLPLNNLSIYGYSIKKGVQTDISISNPKTWPPEISNKFINNKINETN